MKIGDKVYCILDDYMEIQPNNFILVTNAPISNAIKRFKPYEVHEISGHLAILNESNRWMSLSCYMNYFITEKEFRKFKLEKLNKYEHTNDQCSI